MQSWGMRSQRTHHRGIRILLQRNAIEEISAPRMARAHAQGRRPGTRLLPGARGGGSGAMNIQIGKRTRVIRPHNGPPHRHYMFYPGNWRDNEDIVYRDAIGRLGHRTYAW